MLVGLAAPGTDDVFEALVYPVLGALLYATFLQVPFTALHAAFADRRFLVAALGLNFPVVPAIVLAGPPRRGPAVRSPARGSRARWTGRRSR